MLGLLYHKHLGISVFENRDLSIPLPLGKYSLLDTSISKDDN